MNEADLKLLRTCFQELKERTEDNRHQRILEAALSGDDDFLRSMEKELGNYLLEVLKDED